MLNQILRPIARRAAQRGNQIRSSHGHHESDFKKATFDEATAPSGSWQENFDKQQRKFNTQLIVGVASLVVTCVAINRFELLYFNWGPPKAKE